MSKSREYLDQDDMGKLEDELDQYKANLTKSLKTQSELEKRLKLEQATRNKEQKNHKQEKDALLKKHKELNSQFLASTQYAERLENELTAANIQIRSLTDALDAEYNNVSIPAFQNNPLNNEVGATATASVASDSKSEEKASQSLEKAEAPAMEPIASSTYSIFSPWRLLGYKNQDVKPTPENPTHITLADLTKASVEQALAEKTASPKI